MNFNKEFEHSFSFFISKSSQLVKDILIELLVCINIHVFDVLMFFFWSGRRGAPLAEGK